MNYPAGGISTEQCTLRAAQYFYSLDIKQLTANGIHTRHVAIIDIHRNRCFVIIGKVILRNTTNVKGHQVRRKAGHLQTGHLFDDFDGVGYAQGLHLITGKCGDGDSYILLALLTLLRGNNNFFKHCCVRAKRNAAQRHRESQFT